MTLDTIILDTLDDLKAQNVVNLDVTELTSITSNMIIATGTSSTHIKGIANHLISKLKDVLNEPIKLEGLKENEWILIDAGDVVVHVMSQEARNFYQLEKLWSSFDMQTYVAV